MRLLVPAGETADPVLNANAGAIAQVATGAAQVSGGERHVAGLVGPTLDPRLAAQHLGDELQQPVEAHPGTAADVERRARPCGRPPQPVERRDRKSTRLNSSHVEIS